MVSITLNVNGTLHAASVDDAMLLVDYLREELGLTGTHVGCDTSQCGACTVRLDGASVKSCSILVAQASGGCVTTIEGLAQDGRLHPVQDAFVKCHGLQCGFCTPGMVMAVEDFVGRHEGTELPDEAIHTALEGNLCRCTGYVHIIAAVRHAVAAMRPSHAQDEERTTP